MLQIFNLRNNYLLKQKISKVTSIAIVQFYIRLQQRRSDDGNMISRNMSK
jgi:hypothetical protein